MRYLVLVAAFLVLVVGCEDLPNEKKAGVDIDPFGDRRDRYHVVEIEGCEYVVVYGGVGDSRYYSITHKGDCCNPIHPRNTEQPAN